MTPLCQSFYTNSDFNFLCVTLFIKFKISSRTAIMIKSFEWLKYGNVMQNNNSLINSLA